MFHQYSDIPKLQLAIGIAGIISGLCFHFLPLVPKIAKKRDQSAPLSYAITGLCYGILALYADKTNDPLFYAFNSTGYVISSVYAYITLFLALFLSEDKLVQDASGRFTIMALAYVLMMGAAIVSTYVQSRIILGVVAIIAFVVVCVLKLGFQTKDVGPASLLVMIWNGAIWVAYGVLVKDEFICVLSGIGCGAGVAGLVLLRVKNRNNDNKLKSLLLRIVGDDIV